MPRSGATFVDNLYTAGEVIHAGRLVVVIDNLIYQFQINNILHASFILGVSTASYLPGRYVSTAHSGKINDSSFVFINNSVIYSDDQGVLTDNIPSGLILKRVGRYLLSNEILLENYPPLIRKL